MVQLWHSEMRYVCWKISHPSCEFTCRIKLWLAILSKPVFLNQWNEIWSWETETFCWICDVLYVCTKEDWENHLLNFGRNYFYNLELPVSIENTGIVGVMKMKEADKVRNEVISDTYRVSGLTKGSVLTLDIGPVPTTQLNGPKKPFKYRSEIQVGTVMSYSWRIHGFSHISSLHKPSQFYHHSSRKGRKFHQQHTVK